jgi:PRC-barrel domain
MTAPSSYEGWVGRDAVDQDGEKIGEIADIYVDETTGRPEWAAVSTGLFGRKVSFAPLAGSSQDGDSLRLAHSAAAVKDAPNADPDGHLEPEEEARLYAHYG